MGHLMLLNYRMDRTRRVYIIDKVLHVLGRKEVDVGIAVVAVCVVVDGKVEEVVFVVHVVVNDTNHEGLSETRPIREEARDIPVGNVLDHQRCSRVFSTSDFVQIDLQTEVVFIGVLILLVWLKGLRLGIENGVLGMEERKRAYQRVVLSHGTVSRDAWRPLEGHRAVGVLAGGGGRVGVLVDVGVAGMEVAGGGGVVEVPGVRTVGVSVAHCGLVERIVSVVEISLNGVRVGIVLRSGVRVAVVDGVVVGLARTTWGVLLGVRIDGGAGLVDATVLGVVSAMVADVGRGGPELGRWGEGLGDDGKGLVIAHGRVAVAALGYPHGKISGLAVHRRGVSGSLEGALWIENRNRRRT